eukprot:tig00001234_g7742.t1
MGSATMSALELPPVALPQAPPRRMLHLKRRASAPEPLSLEHAQELEAVFPRPEALLRARRARSQGLPPRQTDDIDLSGGCADIDDDLNEVASRLERALKLEEPERRSAFRRVSPPSRLPASPTCSSLGWRDRVAELAVALPVALNAPPCGPPELEPDAPAATRAKKIRSFS